MLLNATGKQLDIVCR